MDNPLMRLLEQLRSSGGDWKRRDAAWESLYNAIRIELHLYILRRVKESDIGDVMQETLKAVYRNLDSFKGCADLQFKKWCYTIAMRKAADSHSFRERMEVLPTEELIDLIDQSAKYATLSPQDRLDLEEAMKLLEKAKPECRELLWKHYVLGLDFSELAAELMVKYDTARQRVNRCRDLSQGLI